METTFADESQIETLALANFADLIDSLFPELSWRVSRSAKSNKPLFFLYLDGARWNTELVDSIDAYAIRAIAVWDGESAPSPFGSSIAVYVVGLTTYQ